MFFAIPTSSSQRMKEMKLWLFCIDGFPYYEKGLSVRGLSPQAALSSFHFTEAFKSPHRPSLCRNGWIVFQGSSTPAREGGLPPHGLPPSASHFISQTSHSRMFIFFIIYSPCFKPFANHPKFTDLYFHKNYNPKNRIHSLLPILSALVKIDININCY